MAFDVLVVGSANCDLITALDRRPGPGETVLGGDLRRLPGGKGANQAWSAGRAGVRAGFLACLGRDDAAELILASLGRAGVDTTPVRRVDAPTGCALITVTPDGENAIVVCPGANAHLTPELVGAAPELDEARVVVAQLEVPPASITALAERSTRSGYRFVVNAAPSAPLPAAVLAACDPLVVNQSEAADLVGRDGTPDELVDALLRLGPKSVIMTLGADGSLVASASERERVDAKRVDAVDTTGAGDAFLGAAAAALSTGATLREAAECGTEAAALVVQHDGAQPSL